MCAFRVAQGSRRMWMGVALIALVGADYKAFGTSKRFDAANGKAERYSASSFTGMGDDVYQQLRSDAAYRVIVDNDTGPPADNLRHVGLITPQGFDPQLTRELRKMAEANGAFRTDRLFDIDLDSDAALRLLGVKYVISSEYSKAYPRLKDN